MSSNYSLKKRLILYISFFSISLGCVLVFSAYRIALEEINEILDAQMQNLAERIAAHGPEQIQSQFDEHQRYHEEDLFVDVWAYTDQDHQSQSKRLVAPVEKAGFYTHQTASDIWRTYVLPLEHDQIQVSQQLSVRRHLALELAGNMFIPYLLFMPLVLWGLGWIISHNLKPLDEFKEEIAKREPHELEPVQIFKYPQEIVPVLNEINSLFSRIQYSQQEQRQFIANAAHELRTPITALNLQIQILLQEFPDHPALKNLNKGLMRVQHLVSQLLSLAQQDANILETEHSVQVRVSDIATNCVEELIQLAIQKNIDLGMEQQDPVSILSEPAIIHSIIFNLIDNAIKYTPENGVINVSVYARENGALIQIEDSGPGIDPMLYEKVLQRFYRVYQHTEIGSGLGLSIVHKATQRLKGRLSFTHSQTLGGLQVNILLPDNIL